ncbi:MAG: hypothetical protein ABJC05_03775 [Pyrinomonadaceae bacterium]
MKRVTQVGSPFFWARRMTRGDKILRKLDTGRVGGTIRPLARLTV